MQTLILGILHVFLKISLKKGRDREKKRGKAWKAPKELFLVGRERRQKEGEPIPPASV